MREQDDALDLMALAEEAQLGNLGTVPVPTTARESGDWVEAGNAGIPNGGAPAPLGAPHPARVPATPVPATPEPVHH